MTGFGCPPPATPAMVGPVAIRGRSPGSHAAQFSKTASRPARGLPRAPAPFQARPASISTPGRLPQARRPVRTAEGSRAPRRVVARRASALEPAEAALADLEHACRRAASGRQVERVRARPTSPSSLTAPWAISRRASLDESPNSAAISAGRCTGSPSPAASRATGISSGSSRAHVDLVEARLGRRAGARRRGSGR